MGETIEVAGVSDEEQRQIDAAVAAIARGGGETVRGLALVGEAVPPRRHRGAARIHLVALVAHAHVATLTNLGRDLPASVALSVFSAAELTRAADVFALELAEQRSRHVTLRGRIPYDQLPITARLLRLAIERALRVEVQALRSALWSGPEPLLGQLRRAVERLATVAHQLPPVLGAPGPESVEADEAALLRDLFGRADADGAWVDRWGAYRQTGSLEGPVRLAGEILHGLDAVVALVDGFGAPPGMAPGPGDA
ncbi:MAG: hypothetical protein AAF715_24745 [Myxococcota bacterium]